MISFTFSVFVIHPIMVHPVHGQALITILLGDELNSDKIEFGLVGGINQFCFSDAEESLPLINFSLDNNKIEQAKEIQFNNLFARSL